MDIELYKAEKLNQKGSSLRKSIQNNNTPILDLLVRESIQNSLDAADQFARQRYVGVDFTVGTFDRATMERELSGVPFSKMDWGDRFIAIRDYNTTGLTGVYEDKRSNLFRLVYGIMEAQQASGAGGSWGIGKTVYFRVGTGLVLYYSRVKTVNGFESLLAADFVEDETGKEAILPAVDGVKYGIAFWGKRIPRKDSVKETRDERVIKRMLNAFGLEPFEDEATGTVIMIPYINEDVLLRNNVSSDDSSAAGSPFWTKSIEDFLRISVQRWYSARLANRYYNGRYLNVKVNGKFIKPDNMEPFFRVTQALYNKAALTIADSSDVERISIPDVEILCEEIRINTHINPNEAGRIAFAKFTRKQLGMVAPGNCPSPYVYINSAFDEDDLGRPILMYCRKPGMVVSYEIRNSAWTDGIPATGEDEFLIGYFVLNSAPMLQGVDDPLSLEDYVRKTEKADHSAWEDCDLGTIRPKIIDRMKKNVAKKVAAAYEEEQEEEDKSADSGLSTLLGRVLLPPEGFGRKPSQSPEKDPGTETTTHRNIRYSYSVLEFTPNGMVVSLRATTGKRSAASLGFEFKMDSVTGPIGVSAWEGEMGLALPFTIKSVGTTLFRLDEGRPAMKYLFKEPGNSTFGPMSFSSLVSKGGGWYGQTVGFTDGATHQFDIHLRLEVAVSRKDVKPVLTFDV